jgi:very-short-patch-repair endonuclease
MPAKNIVIGQRVDPTKVERSKELRREMTPAERILWQQLRRNQLNGLHFRRQQIIDGFIADFYCHAAGLVIELDGGIHQQQADYDAERDRVLTARGLHVMRFKNEEVLRDLQSVLARIQVACGGKT